MSAVSYKTIVVGVAFSPTLKPNLFEAIRLARLFGAQLVLVHVGVKSSIKAEKINRVFEAFGEKPPRHEMVWQEGKPVDVLLEACSAKNADLLMVGAMQREALFTYYVGSVARKLTRKAPCDVLLLIKPSIDRVACQHVVVNGLEHPKTKEAIATSFFVAQSLGAKKITIVEEIPEKDVKVKVDDDWSLRKATIMKERIKVKENSRVQKILSSLSTTLPKSLLLQIQPIFGRRGYSIGHYAKVVRADLLVMNAPKPSSLWDRIFPHDIEYILSDLPTDVLIVRHE